MKEIESIHGKADVTPIKGIQVRFVLYDGTIPTIRQPGGSVYRPGQTVSVNGVPVY